MFEKELLACIFHTLKVYILNTLLIVTGSFTSHLLSILSLITCKIHATLKKTLKPAESPDTNT